jgi:hypothetical protein
VLQPVIQFGTAIHGESFSGGALNRVQKLRRVGNNVSVLRKNFQVFRMDSSKRGSANQCGGGHSGPSRSIHEFRISMVDPFDSCR